MDKSPIMDLADMLGIDSGPLNQADLQEQVCSKALAQIQHLQNQLDKTCAPGCTPADAEKLREANHALADELSRFKQERDEALAYAERLRGAWGVVQNTDWDQPMNEVIDEFPSAALASLKAEWQAEAVQSILDECEQWSLMSTWGILVEDISEKLEGLYQGAQEAGDA